MSRREKSIARGVQSRTGAAYSTALMGVREAWGDVRGLDVEEAADVVTERLRAQWAGGGAS